MSWYPGLCLNLILPHKLLLAFPKLIQSQFASRDDTQLIIPSRMYFLLQMPWERAGGNLPRAWISARALFSFLEDLPHPKGIPQISAEPSLKYLKHWECSMKDWGRVYTPAPPTPKSPIPARKCGGTSLFWSSGILELFRLEKPPRSSNPTISPALPRPPSPHPCPQAPHRFFEHFRAVVSTTVGQSFP